MAGVEAVHHATGPGMHELVVLANILVVFAIVYLGARKGILGALKSRSEGVNQKLQESKAELLKVTNALSDVKTELQGFESMRTKMIAQVRSEAEAVSRTILEDAKQSADRILQDAKLSAKDEARNAMSGLRKELVQAAVLETQKVVMHSKDQQTTLHKQLLEGLNSDIKGVQAHGS